MTIDGRETNYFEWLGAGMYTPEVRGGAMHGRTWLLRGLRFGFSQDAFFLRVDPAQSNFAELRDAEFRVLIRAKEEVRAVVEIREGRVAGCYAGAASGETAQREPSLISAAIGKILEIRLEKALFDLQDCARLHLAISIWQGGLPMDFLPVEGPLQIALGEENFAWGV